LIGFAGSPVDARHLTWSRQLEQGFAIIKKMLFDQPALLHKLLATTARRRNPLPQCPDRRRRPRR